MLFLFLTGCRPGEKESRSEKTGFSSDSAIGFENQAEQREIYYRFPSAREMLTYIKTDKLEYRTDLVNPVGNLDHYHSTIDRALNLGVYLADLSYMILFDKTQQTDEYFNVLFNLTKDLRIKIPEEEKLIERISENMYNSDSLINIADTYHTEVINHLLNTGNEKTLAVISTGSYIEGLYIALNLVSDFNQNKVTIDKIVDQKYAFKNLAKYAQNFEKDLNTRYSLRYLEEINAFFDKLPVIEEETKVKRSDKQTLVVEGGSKTEINRQQFEEFKKKVIQIRSEIINKNPDKE